MRVRPRQADKQRRGRLQWGGVLFGSIFFAVGAGFLLFSIVPSLYDWVRMADWVAIDADVENVVLNRHQGSDTTTYQASVRYHYNFGGQRFSGERVGIDSGSDNIGSWHEETYARVRGREMIPVWVNPDAPEEAVYDRELRWGLLGFKAVFVVVFAGIGAAIMWFSARGARASVAAGPSQAQGRGRWAENLVRSNAKTGVWVAWGMAAFWNALSSPILFVVPEELARGKYVVLIGLLFPLIGMFLLAHAVRETLRWRRFGATPLTLDPFPGSLGGDVGGAIELNLSADPRYVFEIILTCNHVYESGSGKQRRTRRDVVWQDSQRVQLEAGMRGSRLRFQFQVPADLPESGEPSSAYYEWVVEASANLPGADFKRRFEIPVFATGAQRAGARPPATLERVQSVEPALGPVRLEESGGGLRVVYPLGRNWTVAFWAIVFGLIFGAAVWLPRVFDPGGGPPLFMVAIFTLVGGLVLIWGLYLAGNSLVVTASRAGLVSVRRIFGYAVQRRMARDEIASIEKAIGAQSSSGGSTRAWYHLRAVSKDGRRMSVGDTLPSASVADAVISHLHTALDLDGSGRSVPGERPRSGRREFPQRSAKSLRRAILWGGAAVAVAILAWHARGFIAALLR